MGKLKGQVVVSHLVIFFNPEKTVGKSLKIEDVSRSKEGIRSSRPGLIQKKNENFYLCAFFSTKSHSKLRFEVVKCCPLGDVTRILRHENYLMVIGSRSVFELPSLLVDQWKRSNRIKVVAGCIFDLEKWSGECVKKVEP
uniref:Uncharacterized protein n=1 Tax=Pseudothermotoga hypogea TaxID=57487 RepID=A0A832I5L5_9THEM